MGNTGGPSGKRNVHATFLFSIHGTILFRRTLHIQQHDMIVVQHGSFAQHESHRQQECGILKPA